jgi:hypothetical protein
MTTQTALRPTTIAGRFVELRKDIEALPDVAAALRVIETLREIEILAELAQEMLDATTPRQKGVVRARLRRKLSQIRRWPGSVGP